MLEYEYNCPYCMEYVTTLVDPSIPQQSYIEDCQVCCNPISFDITIDEGEIVGFIASDIEQ